ncbi:MAG: septum formation protein Maf [Bradymonadaceae bacterium]|nr:septum formation protein Maf [Lujinxingiaceae bacterium]
MEPLTAHNRRIILASGSPRRLELARRIGLEPHVMVSHVPEIKGAHETPQEYTRRLAILKAQDVAQKLIDSSEPADWILAADTIVVFEGDVLEKPVDFEDACRMLGRLSGQSHTVITSFCWMSRRTREGQENLHAICSVEARVHFRELDEAMIQRYVASGEPMDKAGAYGIQDVGSTIVRHIEGSYFCVVGLPVCEVIETLQDLGGLVDYPF